MGIEIERKFLVPGEFPQGIKQYQIKQGYLDPSLCLIRISRSLNLLSIYGKR
jgi:CYTH domain-containing protein